MGPVTKRAARRLHQDVREYLLRISNVHMSLRQASEWVPRWKKRLKSDHFQRRLVIEAIVLIHNYHMELVGYVRIHILEGYDRITQYYFKAGEYNSDDNDNGKSNGSDEEM